MTAIDLFSGGGGLTVGLKRAGFRVALAIDMDRHAMKTYGVNHPDVHVARSDVEEASGNFLRRVLKGKEVDLLAGCPPCQGFTSLTSKYRSDDPRNQLVFEMCRLAKEVRPRAVMMENVPGLIRSAVYRRMRQELGEAGYVVTDGVLQVADYGVPQSRRRLVMVAGLGFRIQLTEPTHSDGGRDGLACWRTVRQTIGHMDGNPPTLAEARMGGGVQKANWHVVRTLSPQNVARIRAARPGRTWPSMPEELRPKCHRGGYNGFTNVYGRMAWDKPSPTITGGCTTLSKGRFGHPEEDRTISVREAALLQTFPEDYVFDTPYMEHVCNIIGNALPCDFAEVVARQCYDALNRNSRDSVRA